MKIHIGLSILAFLSASALGQTAEVTVGMSENDLFALMGKPSSRIARGEQSILKWPELSVTVEKRKVTKVSKIANQTSQPVTDAPADIEGFRDLKWGDDLSKREGFVLISKADSSGVANWTRKDERLAIGELELTEIIYTTFEGKFARVIITPASSVSLTDLITAFTAKYDQPRFTDYKSAAWKQQSGDAMVIDGRHLFASISSIELSQQMENAKTRSLGNGAKSDL